MILVIGDLILDNFSINEIQRKSPEANVPIIKNYELINKIGGAGNVANNINKIDKSCILISRIGKNINDKILIRLINENKIKNKLFYEEDFSVGKKIRFFINNNQKFRLDEEIICKIKKKTEKKIINYVKKNLNRFSLLIVSDYKKGLISKNLFKEISKLFMKEKKIIITNPKQQDIRYYSNSTIIVPNEKEFDSFFKKNLKFSSKIKIFFKKSKIENLIITRGKKKLLFFNKEKKNFI